MSKQKTKILRELDLYTTLRGIYETFGNIFFIRFYPFFLQFNLKILIEFVTTLFKGGIFLWVTSIQCICQSMREIAVERTGR